jgi:hypothetical protein
MPKLRFALKHELGQVRILVSFDIQGVATLWKKYHGRYLPYANIPVELESTSSPPTFVPVQLVPPFKLPYVLIGSFWLAEHLSAYSQPLDWRPNEVLPEDYYLS